jgi:predicted secreted protein
MNERWKYMINQAIKEIGPEDKPSKEETLKRYAELIVKECMELCKKQEYDYWRSSEDQDFTPIDCADAIKEWFGVEV